MKSDFHPSCCSIDKATMPVLYQLAACFVSSQSLELGVRLAPSSVLFDTNPTVGDAKQAFRISSGSPLFESRLGQVDPDVSLGRVLGKEAG